MTEEARGVAYAFWRRVEDARLDVPLTKLELAKRAGVSRNAIDRLETSSQGPRIKTVHALADLLHIDRREAETLAGLRLAEPEEPVQASGRSVRDAIAAAGDYTPEQRKMLLTLIDTIERANGLMANSD